MLQGRFHSGGGTGLGATAPPHGQKLGFYDADFGVLLRVIGNSVFFTLLVWHNAVSLHRADLRRGELLAAEQEARRQAEALAQQLREAVQARDTFLQVAAHELTARPTGSRS
ncbi:hypothetical protein [Archangium sp.]|uniref:hypothetical protein n=1 Tax=Archangium sp. TaxID=1872627 RepID=UPI002D662CD2|nr:hypothetical protein [Archangium sp.]HYO57900.1 hypothetical protein [Archangium sp.]